MAGSFEACWFPDRIENCTPELIRRSAAISEEFDCPIQLHCCQGLDEFDTHRRALRQDADRMAVVAGLSVEACAAAARRVHHRSQRDRRAKGDDVGLARRIRRNARSLPAGAVALRRHDGILHQAEARGHPDRARHRHLPAGHGREHADRHQPLPRRGRRRRGLQLGRFLQCGDHRCSRLARAPGPWPPRRRRQGRHDAVRPLGFRAWPGHRPDPDDDAVGHRSRLQDGHRQRPRRHARPCNCPVSISTPTATARKSSSTG